MKAKNSRLDSSGNRAQSGNQVWEILPDFKRKEIKSEKNSKSKRRKSFRLISRTETEGIEVSQEYL